MKILVQGRPVLLDKNAFVGQGGQGAVYAIGSLAYKIYLDPVQATPAGKVQELSQIQHPDVIRPLDLIYDEKGKTLLGYTMRYIPRGVTWEELITRPHREQNGIDHAKMLRLIEKMKALMLSVHAGDCVIVDMNALNFLVAQDEVYGIDVDSYRTKSFPAVAIMDSIRDPQVNNADFQKTSDYYAFSILSYLGFRGIHPYRGIHDKVKLMVDRMKQNLWVEDPSVRVPKSVYPETVIPPGYREWFKAVLRDGKRIPPPADPGHYTVIVAVVAVVATGKIKIELTRIPAHRVGGKINGKVYLINVFGSFNTVEEKFGRIEAMSDKGENLLLTPVNGTGVSYAEDRAYFTQDNRIMQLSFAQVGVKTVGICTMVAQVMPFAHRLYPGCVIQNMAGACYVSLFAKENAAYQCRIKEIEGLTVLDAKYERGVLAVRTTDGKGNKKGFTFVFSPDFMSYSLADTPTSYCTNFTVLDSGVVVRLIEDEKLELWRASSPGTKNVVHDAGITTAMRLGRVDGGLVAVVGYQVYSLKMA